ncbi:pilus assembly protein [Pseudomaricurvus sp. HS19]|uniref:pilus assembly protein n=1 Tax=Pseudomaricurvus sp. HS19 TaxID=2692626 RepID=UPI00351A65FD
MVQSSQVNIASLNMVSDELVATIEEAAGKLEQFVTNPDAGREPLDACAVAIDQVRGTLKLVQLGGASILAEEVLLALQGITDTTSQSFAELKDALTDAFFILPRYLEYTQQSRRNVPVLLLSYINELRSLRKVPDLPESHFLQYGNSNPAYNARATSSAMTDNELAALLKRLRHMYQVGLLSVLQNRQIPSGLGIMERALERLEFVSGPRRKTPLWWTAGAALNALRTSKMEVSKSRKLALMALDRELKALVQTGIGSTDQDPPEALVGQFLFLLSIADSPSERAEAILQAYQVTRPGYTDRELQREKEALRGPSLNTVASVAAVLQDEIRQIKEILENASQAHDRGLAEYGELAAHLDKVADILAVVGLTAAGQSLRQEIARIEHWRDQGQMADNADLIEIADSLLYVESSVSSLEKSSVSDEKLQQANNIARREVIASSQLAEAEKLVIEEAEAGLALVKRALSSYAESSFDPGHIKNVGSTLTAIRGGFTVLGLSYAADIVRASVEFIEDLLKQSSPPAALQQMLETFADAVIGLEYYLDTLEVEKGGDASVLSIAEESLRALGYRVNN